MSTDREIIKKIRDDVFSLIPDILRGGSSGFFRTGENEFTAAGLNGVLLEAFSRNYVLGDNGIEINFFKAQSGNTTLQIKVKTVAEVDLVKQFFVENAATLNLAAICANLIRGTDVTRAVSGHGDDAVNRLAQLLITSDRITALKLRDELNAGFERTG